MNARRVSAAAGVVFAAMKTRQTATGIAAALESARMLQSPETAAEQLAQLRELDGLRLRVAKLESELRIGAPWKCDVCGKDNRRNVCVICETDRPEPAATPAPGELAEQRHLVDELDHVLEHLADNAPADNRRAESVTKLRGLLARQSGGAL